MSKPISSSHKNVLRENRRRVAEFFFCQSQYFPMGLENTTAFLCPTITKPHSRLAILAYFRKMERIWDKDKESAGKSNKKCSSGIHCKCKKSESAFFHVHKCVSVAFSGQKMKGPWFSGIESALVYILPLDGHKWLFWLIRKNTYLQERIINQNR